MNAEALRTMEGGVRGGASGDRVRAFRRFGSRDVWYLQYSMSYIAISLDFYGAHCRLLRHRGDSLAQSRVFGACLVTALHWTKT